MATTQERLESTQLPPVGSATEAPVTGRRRRVLIPAGIVLVIIGLIFGIRYLVYASHHVSTDDAQIEGDITTMSARVKGQVQAVYVHENQYVHKGDRLLQIDDRDYVVAVDQARAALAQAIASDQAAVQGVPLQSAVTAAQTAQAQAGVEQASGQTAAAQARLEAANSGVSAAIQRVSSAQSQAAAATASATKAQLDMNRAKELVAEGAIARSQWDAAQSAYATALANQQTAARDVAIARVGVDQANEEVSQAQAALTQAQAGIAAGNAQVQQAQTGTQTTNIKAAQAQTASAQVKAAQAALAAAELQLSYTTVTAPIDGTVSKKSVNIGDTVAVSQPLLAIASTSNLWITANLKETQITNVRVGQPVEIKVDAFPGRTFTGKVLSLSPATGATFSLIPPDNASGNFTKVVQRVPARISVDPASDPEHLLKQGLSVEVAIDSSNH
jgi:membrane fusion protein (multidrug efflux system)